MNFDALPQAYKDRIAAIVKEADPRKIITSDCSCDLAHMRHGWTPDMFGPQQVKACVKAWAYHRMLNTLFWGVHLGGKHVLYVPNRYGV